MESVIRTTGRCVGLARNYLKVSRDSFVAFIEEFNSGATLLHVKDAKGNRQEIVYKSVRPRHMNRKLFIEFIDWRIKSEEKDSMLEVKLFACFSILPMVAVYRRVSIFYLTICAHVRLISGNSHRLAEHGWLVQSKGRMIYLLDQKIIVKNNRRRFHDEPL